MRNEGWGAGVTGMTGVTAVIWMTGKAMVIMMG